MVYFTTLHVFLKLLIGIAFMLLQLTASPWTTETSTRWQLGAV